MSKLIEIASSATVCAFLGWIVLSFLEIGFTNTAQTWNFIKIILEVF